MPFTQNYAHFQNTIFLKSIPLSSDQTLKASFRVSLKLIAAALPASEKVALSALFCQLKGADSEAISASQLEAAFVRRGGSRIRKLDIFQLIHDINSPGTNQICYLDFIAANMRVRTHTYYISHSFMDLVGSISL